MGQAYVNPMQENNFFNKFIHRTQKRQSLGSHLDYEVTSLVLSIKKAKPRVAS